MRRRGRRLRSRAPRVAAAAVLLAALSAPAALAYTAGTGNLLTENFEDGNDDGWQNGPGGALARWEVADRGGSKAYLADGRPDGARVLPETSRRAFHSVYPASFDLCFGIAAAGGPGFEFRADARPPRDDAPFYRFRIAADGAIEVQQVIGGTPSVVASTPAGAFPFGTPMWARVRIRGGPGGASDVTFRLWTGSAAGETAAWDAGGRTAAPDPVPYLSRVEFSADTPAGAEVTLDEVDVYGDTSSGVPSSIRTVWVVELSHLDIGFTDPPDDIEAFAKTHLDQVMTNLRNQPGYRWNIEEAWWLLRWMERSTPAEVAAMMDLLREGRIRLMAGTASLHSTATVREELIRSVSYATALGRANGFPVRTYVHDDVPGATWALPEILAKSGIEYYVGGMNAMFGGALTRPSHAERPFWWEGPDGSRVLAWLTFDSYAEGLGKYGMSFFDNLAAMHGALGLALPEQEGLGYPHASLLVMRGFDNHYQSLHVKNLADQWNATYAEPRIVLTSPEEFLDALRVEIAASGWTIPVFRGDFGSAWTGVMPGTAHTHRWGREAHRDAAAAEIFAAAAWALGGAHPSADLATAWRRMLDVDEHSGGGGPWPGYMTPEETDRQNFLHQGYATEARDAAARALDAALADLSARLDLPGGGIAVWNARDFARAAPVVAALPPEVLAAPFRLVDAARGAEVPWEPVAGGGAIRFVAEDVPGLGWKAYRVLPGTPEDPGPGDLSAAGSAIENGFYRVTVDPADGSIVSILHKPAGRELADPLAAWRFGQAACSTGTETFWGLPPAAVPPSSAVATSSLDGPVSASLSVARLGTPAASMTVRLWRGLDRVEFASVVDRDRMPYRTYAEGGMDYALTFPFSLRDFSFATESPAALLRPATDGFERSGLWAALNSAAAIHAEDPGGGLVLASPECELSEWGGISHLLPAHRTAEATLFLRVKAKAWEAQWLDGTTGPFEDEPGTPPLYPATLSLRALPGGESDPEIRRAGWDLVDALRARYVPPASGALPAGGRSLFSTSDPAARVLTVKRSADGAALVGRIEEMGGAARSAGFRSVLDLASPVAADLQEVPGLPLGTVGREVIVPVGALGTETFRAQASASFSPVLLKVRKDRAAGDVLLSWTGGIAPHIVLRSLRKDLAGDTGVLDPACAPSSFTDAGALSDPRTFYYDIE